MITLSTAENALKTVYLGVIGNQLNTGANPLLTRIKQTTNNVYGNEVVKATSYGISGGVSAGSETDALPASYNRNFAQLKSTLKNLYGTIEISDKAIKCSQNSAGAFVNFLNDEMESLIKSSQFNLGRMLYGDGSGILAKITDETEIAEQDVTVDSTRNFAVNLACRYVNTGKTAYVSTINPFVVQSIDKANNKIVVSIPHGADLENYYIASVNGLNNEITGLGSIFGTSTTLYGLNRTNNPWLKPYTKTSVGSISESAIQTAIDEINEVSGANVDFIVCSAGVRRAYQECMNTYKRNIDVVDLQGGFKALTYNGIPVVADRFVGTGEMFLLSSKDFELCQLGDWQWMEDNDGKIIKQKEGYPVYTATLVKYAELLCNRPNSQAKLSNITEA